MAVLRVHKTKDYTVMSNYHFREKDMSLKAKGLLSLMLSLPDDWDYSVAGLVAIVKENKTAVTTALKELKNFGYLVVTKYSPNNTKSGRFEYVYDVYEQPQKNLKAEKQDIENLYLENPPQLNTNKSNTKILNTNKDVEERKKEEHTAAPTGYDAIIKNRIFNEEVKTALYEFIKMRKFIKKPMTDFALNTLIDKLEGLTDDPQKQAEILKKSILNNWQDIFPLKEEKQPQAAAGPRESAAPLLDKDEETDPNDVLQYIKGNVLLSENQIAALLEKLGLEAFDFYIEKISNYIKEHGAIKGHYSTILRWYKEDSAVAR